MSKMRDWDNEDDYRDFKRPKKIDKDKFGKHRNAIYDMLDDEDEDDYYSENRVVDNDFDEE
jgi:hypothetical protein